MAADAAYIKNTEDKWGYTKEGSAVECRIDSDILFKVLKYEIQPSNNSKGVIREITDFEDKKHSVTVSHKNYVGLKDAQKFFFCSFYNLFASTPSQAEEFQAAIRQAISLTEAKIHGDSNKRDAITSCNDMCRVINLLDFSEAAVYFTKAARPLESRAELDASRSGVREVSESANP